MKLKKLAVTAALAICAAPVLAQNFEGTTYDDRIGYSNDNNPDSIKVGLQNISMFQMSLQNQDYKEARINMRWLLKHAPYALTGIYTQGPYVYFKLISDETDQAKKLEYFNEMMEIFAAREKNLEALNTFAKTKSTLGDVLALKADYYNWTAPNTPGSGYTLNKSYDNYSKAIKMINEKGGREIEGSVLQNFFLVSDAMYKSAPNALREQYLQDYMDSKDACEKMLQLAKEAKAEGDEEKANKLLAKYDGPLALIDKTFAESGAADSAQIVSIYTKKFDAYKEDINKLNSAITLMNMNDCDDSEIYYKYAEAAYAIEPTYTSAIGLAQKAHKDGEMEKMLDYYNKALELASSDASRGQICLKISYVLTKGKQYTGALTYAEKAIGYNPDLTGKVYLNMATIYAVLGQFATAIEYCDKACEADISLCGEAGRRKANIQRVQATQQANDKYRKEYDDFMKRKKAEEDFWNGAGKK